jgi:hypothetical protein
MPIRSPPSVTTNAPRDSLVLRYFGINHETRELHASGSTNSDWTDHELAEVNSDLDATEATIASLWDGLCMNTR